MVIVGLRSYIYFIILKGVPAYMKLYILANIDPFIPSTIISATL